MDRKRKYKDIQKDNDSLSGQDKKTPKKTSKRKKRKFN